MDLEHLDPTDWREWSAGRAVASLCPGPESGRGGLAAPEARRDAQPGVPGPGGTDLEELHLELRLAIGRLRQKPRLIQSFFEGAGLELEKLSSLRNAQ